MTTPSAKGPLASIPAMPKLLRPILLALTLAASAALFGCGDSGPDPSIPQESSQTLLAQLEEIKANVDVDSPCVAADRTDNLIADIQDLPSSVDSDVRQALDNGANNLKLQLSGECEGRTTTTTTTEPTTTEETTTERTEPTTTERTQTEETTPTQTQTTPTQTTPGGGASGGIGPGGL
jgi:hypothetical protein